MGAPAASSSVRGGRLGRLAHRIFTESAWHDVSTPTAHSALVSLVGLAWHPGGPARGRTWPRLSQVRLDPPASACAPTTSSSSRRRSSPRPRGASSPCAPCPRRRTGPGTRRGDGQGRAPRRAGPRRIHRGAARRPRRPHRAPSARIRHGQCRHRPLQRGDGTDGEQVLLLPEDPDASAAALRAALAHARASRPGCSSATASAGPGARAS